MEERDHERDDTAHLRMLTGGGSGEHYARQMMLGQRIVNVEHTMDRDEGDTITLVFGDGRVNLTGRPGTRGRIGIEWRGTAPEGPPAFVVDRYGPVHSWERRPVRWPAWIDVLLHPVQWWRGWRS